MPFADVISPPIQVHNLLTAWQTDWISLTALCIEIVIGVWYVVLTHRLGHRGRRWSPWRTASFLVGTLAVVVATQSGLASYDDSVFQLHVVQHLLLMNVAPIFYALAAPVTLALQASGRGTQRRLLSVLHTRAIEFITHPVLVVINFAGTMLIFFLTPFYQFSLEHPLLHELTHLHFLISGILYWWLIVGVDPTRWRLSFPAKLGALAVGIPTTAVLGLALTQSRVSIAPPFHTAADTHAGGSILWIVGELFTLGAMGIVVIQWMRVDDREAVRADRRVDAADTGSLHVQSGAEATASDAPESARRDRSTKVAVVDGRLVPVEGGRPGVS
ncbi:MAG TPA: cytochrome c oxidase assembly protein [Acidimicrobiales bacterium]|nr:cytochrome c oxidase assembly protein [Acidimicrobiales bacterium]